MCDKNKDRSRLCCRLVFEEPPDEIIGVCQATTIKGSFSGFFTIKLLSKTTTNNLLSNSSFKKQILFDIFGNKTLDEEGKKMVEINVEKIRKLREANEEKERKRVRERDKV